jgi:hypothetical protein
MSNIPNYKTVKKMAEEYPDICPEGALRWDLFNANTNGLTKSGAIIRKGRRVLINVECYFKWIESLQTADKQGS